MKRTSLEFAARLKVWRGKRPQTLAANALDVNLNTYQNWEQGRNVPAPLTQQSVMNAMHRLVEITKDLQQK